MLVKGLALKRSKLVELCRTPSVRFKKYLIGIQY